LGSIAQTNVRNAKSEQAINFLNNTVNQITKTVENPNDPTNPEERFGADAMLLDLEEKAIEGQMPFWLEEALSIMSPLSSTAPAGSSMLDEFEDNLETLDLEEQIRQIRDLGQQFIQSARDK
jgi:hypothetical protein